MGKRPPLLERIDKVHKGSLLGTSRNQQLNPKTVYNDLNRAFGIVFQMIANFMGWKIPGLNTSKRRHSRKSKKKFGMF